MQNSKFDNFEALFKMEHTHIPPKYQLCISPPKTQPVWFYWWNAKETPPAADSKWLLQEGSGKFGQFIAQFSKKTQNVTTSDAS